MADDINKQFLNEVYSAVVGATCYVDGSLVAEDVDFRLPTITPIKADVNLMGKASIPTSVFENMETTITKIGIDYNHAALCGRGCLKIEFKWVQNVYNKLDSKVDYAGYYAYIEGFNGGIPEIGVSQGESISSDITIDTLKYLLQKDDDILYDIDRTVRKYVVNGVDYRDPINSLL